MRFKAGIVTDVPVIRLRPFVLALLLAAPALPASAGLVQDIENHYQKHQSWQAGFSQTTFIEMLNQNLTRQGTILAARPGKLRVEYLTDPKKIYLSDGKKLWVYKEDEDTAAQFDNLGQVVHKEALSFLSGLENLSQIFDVLEGLKEAASTLKIKDKGLKRVTLVPKNVDSGLLHLTLGVDPKSLEVREAVLFNASGNVSHYTFEKIQFDPAVDAGVFTLPATHKVVRQ